LWIFSVHGFVSAVAARKKNGEIDPGLIMLRARDRSHLENLQAAFPDLATSKIVQTQHTDYAFRIFVQRAVWVKVAGELANEVAGYGNFKNEVLRTNGPCLYEKLLHGVWGIMRRLQDKPIPNADPRNADEENDDGFPWEDS
jgi:hypothetical protein